jgi:hypothetical protein
MKQRTLLASPKVPPIPTMSQHRRDAEIEAWISNRLQLRDLFAGVTSTEIRRDRLKAVLLERGLTESIAGRMEGKSVTWRKLFSTLYHAELGD